jgi:3-phenylpropionate/cinnamic acid dioxygenase small subunit
VADRSRIHELLSRFAWASDQGDLEVLSACLTDEVLFFISRADGYEEVGPLDGKEALLEHLKKDIESRSAQERYLVSNVFLEEEGNASATVVSYATITTVSEGKSQLVSTGWTRDKVMFEDGRWKISERRMEFDA